MFFPSPKPRPVGRSLCVSAVAILAFLAQTSELRAAVITWTGGGGSASWSDNANFDSTPLDGNTDLIIGSGFASGTTMTLDGNRTIDTLEFSSGSNGVNVVINPGAPGTSFLFPDNTGDTVNASLQMNSSSHHTINAEVRYAGNAGQESRYNGSGGGVLTLAGGINAVVNGKLEIKTTNNTVIVFASAFTGSSETIVVGGAILRTGDSSHLTSGQVTLNGGTLELTGNTGFDGRFIHNDPARAGAPAIRINNNGGLAAVGSDVSVNFGNTGHLIDLNDIKFGSVHADGTLTLANEIRKSNNVLRIRSVDGPVEVEAILNASELGRSDRVEFNGDGAVQVNNKISSRDNIEVNGGALILKDTAQTASNNGVLQTGKTIDLNVRASAGSEGDAALLLSGAQSRNNFIQVRDTVAGSASLGVFSADAASFTNTVDLDANYVNLYARLAGSTATFSGNIRDTGGVTVNNGFNSFAPGLGTVVLDGNKTYSGATTVKSGTLQIAATVNSLGTSGITVESGATLDNRGDLSGIATLVENGGLATGDGQYGALTVQGGGAINAGTSPGILPSASLDMNANSIFQIEISDLSGQPTAGVGTGWDFYDVSGNLTLAGGGNTVFVDLFPDNPSLLDNDFVIKFAQGNDVLNFGSTQFTVRDGLGTLLDGFSVTFDNNMLFLNYANPDNMEIPEPGSIAMWGLLALLGFAVRRRIKK